MPRPYFACPRCGAVSHNPMDALEEYCGACHDWTGPKGRERPVVHFNRQGEPIPLSEWARLFEDNDYKRVSVTIINDMIVSTIWMGVDHGFGQTEQPVIFETMTFDAPEEQEVFGRIRTIRPEFSGFFGRYSTEDEALDGHQAIVEELRQLLRALNMELVEREVTE